MDARQSWLRPLIWLAVTECSSIKSKHLETIISMTSNYLLLRYLEVEIEIITRQEDQDIWSFAGRTPNEILFMI